MKTGVLSTNNIEVQKVLTQYDIIYLNIVTIREHMFQRIYSILLQFFI